MPIYEYQATRETESCERCAQPFEVMQRISEAPLTACPACGRPVRRLISRPAVGASKSGFDQRAKSAGFRKLQRVSKGEYEVKY